VAESDLLISKKALIVVALALFLFTLVSPIALGDSSSSDDGTVSLHIETDKPLYLRGEVVKVYVYVVNSKNVPVKYPSVMRRSIVYSDGRPVGYALCININWMPPIPTFPPQSKTLFPDSLDDSSFTWSTRNRNGRKLSVGAYTIRVNVAGAEIYLSSEITIRIYPDLDAYPRPTKWGFY
jgi:hypothetical protein